MSERRSDINRYSLAETAIRGAVIAVERMPADPRLTDAVMLLTQAKDKVADYVDGIQADSKPPGWKHRDEPKAP